MHRQKKLATLGTGFLAFLALSGCARPFPERLNWYGHHPALYTMALRAAATEAVFKLETGRDYYAHLGYWAYWSTASKTCDRSGLNVYLQADGRGCDVLGPDPTADCENSQQCAPFRYDPTLFEDRRIQNAVEAALRSPCDYLTPPSSVSNATTPTRLGMSAGDNWRIMLCDGDGVYGENIKFDRATGTLRMAFRRIKDR